MRVSATHFWLRIGLVVLLLTGWGALTGSGGAQEQGLTVRQRPAAPDCREDQLRISDAGFAGYAAGTLAEALEFRSEQRCRLRGHPSVWLLSKAERRLAVVRTQLTEADRPVVLGKGHPTYADLSYENPSVRPKACRLEAYSMGIEVPGTPRTTVAFKTQPMRFCPGTIVVTGFRAPGPFEG
jgi:hypothetical protein